MWIKNPSEVVSCFWIITETRNPINYQLQLAMLDIVTNICNDFYPNQLFLTVLFSFSIDHYGNIVFCATHRFEIETA